jgi:hypothetical protein
MTTPAQTAAATTARDLALGTDGDLELEGGDLQLASGIEAVRQDATARLRFIRGEWFLDATVGLPYFTDVFVKAPDLARLRVLFGAELRATPGVGEVTDLALDFDRAARQLTWRFRATSDLGEVVGSSA